MVLEIHQRKHVRDADEATDLSEFFWRVVDASIEGERNGVGLPWPEGREFWNEKSFCSVWEKGSTMCGDFDFAQPTEIELGR